MMFSFVFGLAIPETSKQELRELKKQNKTVVTLFYQNNVRFEQAKPEIERVQEKTKNMVIFNQINCDLDQNKYICQNADFQLKQLPLLQMYNPRTQKRHLTHEIMFFKQMFEFITGNMRLSFQVVNTTELQQLEIFQPIVICAYKLDQVTPLILEIAAASHAPFYLHKNLSFDDIHFIQEKLGTKIALHEINLIKCKFSECQRFEDEFNKDKIIQWINNW